MEVFSWHNPKDEKEIVCVDLFKQSFCQSQQMAILLQKRKETSSGSLDLIRSLSSSPH